MEIRDALREDLLRILEIQKIGYGREVERTGDQTIPAMLETSDDMEAAFRTCRILKGVEGDVVIGTVRAFLDVDTCKIGRLAVLPEHRGKGYGSALLRAIEARFPSAARYELFTGSLSEDNIRLYEKHGYRQFAAKPVNGTYCLVFLEKPGLASRRELSLGIDMAGYPDHASYRELWKRLLPVEARMVEQHEECRHKLGERLVFDGPYAHPPEICHTLNHVIQLYLWRCSLGFPSWNGADRSIYRIHCPDAKGTVWELKALSRAPSGDPLEA
jgi:ribosomal protein S18 acetylase RimI-like enzyme